MKSAVLVILILIAIAGVALGLAGLALAIQLALPALILGLLAGGIAFWFARARGRKTPNG